ncbi:MAG: Ig-like domain-containing protein, partial [Flammeovirgaceae bacterium]
MRNLISIIAILLLIRCANQTSPTGGPQDKKPPVLLESSPKNNEKNFKAKTFELSFDEPVKLKNANEEVLITPSLGKKSRIVAKKNKVLITPEKPLEENTTYTINFRDAVQDLNEGNPAYNLRLAFSTGPEIDSLQILGSVNELFKEQIPEKITVALYQQDTFNIFNHTPVYFTRTDAKGRFSITNLKAGEYYIYAFEDKSRNLKVDSKSEKFGFQTQPIILGAKKQDSTKIWLTRVDARPLKITSIRNTDRQSKIKFNKAIDSINVTAKDYELIYQYANTQEEILIFNPPKKDSVQIKIVAMDSVGNKLDTVSYIKINNTKLPKERFTIQLNEPMYNIEKQQATIEGTFSKPLDVFTLDSLFIQLDTTQFVTIDKKDINVDPAKHKIKII